MRWESRLGAGRWDRCSPARSVVASTYNDPLPTSAFLAAARITCKSGPSRRLAGRRPGVGVWEVILIIAAVEAEQRGEDPPHRALAVVGPALGPGRADQAHRLLAQRAVQPLDIGPGQLGVMH